jgi:uncharacterized membrane protein YkgB
MKTAIQELIEFIDDKFIVSNSPQISFIYYKAQELLEKEKEQIADAFRNGSTSSMLGGGHWTQYYNQTYNQSK